MLSIDEVLDNVEVTTFTSIVKWCLFELVFNDIGSQCCPSMRYWTMLRSPYRQAKWSGICSNSSLIIGSQWCSLMRYWAMLRWPALTSKVKWCMFILVFNHWVTVMFIDEALDNVEVTILTSSSEVVYVHTCLYIGSQWCSSMRYWTMLRLSDDWQAKWSGVQPWWSHSHWVRVLFLIKYLTPPADRLQMLSTVECVPIVFIVGIALVIGY